MSDTKPLKSDLLFDNYFVETYLSKYRDIKLKTINKLKRLGYKTREELRQIDLRSNSLVQFVGTIKYDQRKALYTALNDLKYGRECDKRNEEVQCLAVVITPKYSENNLPPLVSKPECCSAPVLPSLHRKLIDVKVANQNNKDNKDKDNKDNKDNAVKLEKRAFSISDDEMKKLREEFETRLQQKMSKIDTHVITLD